MTGSDSDTRAHTHTHVWLLTSIIYISLQESDLKSALFLEQAAHSFLRINPAPMTRKYAFHLILAGHHFSKAGQVLLNSLIPKLVSQV